MHLTLHLREWDDFALCSPVTGGDFEWARLCVVGCTRRSPSGWTLEVEHLCTQVHRPEAFSMACLLLKRLHFHHRIQCLHWVHLGSHELPILPDWCKWPFRRTKWSLWKKEEVMCRCKKVAEVAVFVDRKKKVFVPSLEELARTPEVVAAAAAVEARRTVPAAVAGVEERVCP